MCECTVAAAAVAVDGSGGGHRRNSCIQCASSRCLLAGNGATPLAAGKELVIDVTHTHVVAVCDAATLPSQQLSFQQNARF
jgi:hypothetical protein